MNRQEINDSLDKIISSMEDSLHPADIGLTTLDVVEELGETRQAILELSKIMQELLIDTMPEKRFKR